MIARVEISRHPLFDDIRRFVCVYGLNDLNTLPGQEIIDFKYRVEYIKETGEDVTSTLIQPTARWTITNNRQVFVMDENGNRIVDPEWEPNYPLIDGLNNIYAEEPDNVDNQWMRAPAFDYFWNKYNDPNIDKEALFGFYIPKDDIEFKRFDV